MFLETKIITLSPLYYTMLSNFEPSVYYYFYLFIFYTFVTVTVKIIYNDSMY